VSLAELEQFMLPKMSDGAHDREHVYRVLNYAMDIAGYESNVNYEVLSADSMLHDIGCAEQRLKAATSTASLR
jgi:uncharacterized protein